MKNIQNTFLSYIHFHNQISFVSEHSLINKKKECKIISAQTILMKLDAPHNYLHIRAIHILFSYFIATNINKKKVTNTCIIIVKIAINTRTNYLNGFICSMNNVFST